MRHPDSQTGTTLHQPARIPEADEVHRIRGLPQELLLAARLTQLSAVLSAAQPENSVQEAIYAVLWATAYRVRRDRSARDRSRVILRPHVSRGESRAS